MADADATLGTFVEGELGDVRSDEVHAEGAAVGGDAWHHLHWALVVEEAAVGLLADADAGLNSVGEVGILFEGHMLLFPDVGHLGVVGADLGCTFEEDTEFAPFKLVQIVAEVVVDLFLLFPQGQLHLTDEEGVLEFEVDEDVFGGLVELVLDPDDLKVVTFGQDVVVDPVDLLLGARALAPQEIHDVEGHQVDGRLQRPLLVLVPHLHQMLQTQVQVDHHTRLEGLVQMVRKLGDAQLFLVQELVPLYPAHTDHDQSLHDAADAGGLFLEF